MGIRKKPPPGPGPACVIPTKKQKMTILAFDRMLLVWCSQPIGKDRSMLKNLHVLVVDDDPAILETLGNYITGLGHRVTTCGNPRDAEDLLRDEDFSLLITDAQMEGMDGLELTRAARNAHPSMGILLMTAFESAYPLSTALRAGADGYINKPFSLRKFSLVFERDYWESLSRLDWWEAQGGDPVPGAN